MNPSERRVLLGRIVGAHALRGEIVVQAYTEYPEDIAAYGPLGDAAGTRDFALTVVRVTDKGIIARIAGVNDRTAAEALKGTDLWVDRASLPEADAEAGEFYHSDLIGLAAIDPDGKRLGAIVAVQNYGAGDLLEIRLDGRSLTEFLPFTDACVPKIDIAAGRVTVVFPATTGTADPNDDRDATDEPT